MSSPDTLCVSTRRRSSEQYKGTGDGLIMVRWRTRGSSGSAVACLREVLDGEGHLVVPLGLTLFIPCTNRLLRARTVLLRATRVCGCSPFVSVYFVSSKRATYAKWANSAVGQGLLPGVGECRKLYPCRCMRRGCCFGVPTVGEWPNKRVASASEA